MSKKKSVEKPNPVDSVVTLLVQNVTETSIDNLFESLMTLLELCSIEQCKVVADKLYQKPFKINNFLKIWTYGVDKLSRITSRIKKENSNDDLCLKISYIASKCIIEQKLAVVSENDSFTAKVLGVDFQLPFIKQNFDSNEVYISTFRDILFAQNSKNQKNLELLRLTFPKLELSQFLTIDTRHQLRKLLNFHNELKPYTF